LLPRPSGSHPAQPKGAWDGRQETREELVIDYRVDGKKIVRVVNFLRAGSARKYIPHTTVRSGRINGERPRITI
jgi:hypothetical protein